MRFTASAAAAAAAALAVALAAGTTRAQRAQPIRSQLISFEPAARGQHRFCTSAGTNAGVATGMQAWFILREGRRIPAGTIDQVTAKKSCALTTASRDVLKRAPDVEIVP